MLRPLHQWQLDDEGNPKLDKDGKRIPHKKAGQRKADKDLSDADRRSQEDQERNRSGRDERQAKAVVRPIIDALRTLKGKAID